MSAKNQDVRRAVEEDLKDLVIPDEEPGYWDDSNALETGITIQLGYVDEDTLEPGPFVREPNAIGMSHVKSARERFVIEFEHGRG